MTEPTGLAGLGVRAEEPVKALFSYCRQRDWAGFDPYDALNSRLFALTPLSRSRWARIALTQTLKRLPFNVRPVLGISREQNPKGLALFVSAAIKLGNAGILTDRSVIPALVDRIAALRSANSKHWCWGYSFPWQTRTVLVPKASPNLVCTTFVANALLDVHEADEDERLLEMARNAAEFLLEELYWTEGPIAGFSYPFPKLRSQVHNANFLAAGLLARIYRHTGDRRFLEPALKVTRYSANAQAVDGSWTYSELPTQQWIDNFHTGYNLSGLAAVNRYAETTEFLPYIRRGLTFYRDHFFESDGAPKYFHNRTYPIDAHCVAHSLISLVEFAAEEPRFTPLATSVFDWAMRHMWDPEGYFYYQVLPVGRNKLSYMRWTQAWMLLALATIVEHAREEEARAGTAS